MRNILLTSTAAVCLMLTAQVAQAQSDQQNKKSEQKVEHSQKAPDAQQPKHAEKQINRRSTTGQATEEKSNKSESASEKKDQNASKPKDAQNKSEQKEHNRSASEQKSNDMNKRSASEQKPNEAKKSDAAKESNKSKTANEKADDQNRSKAASEKANEQNKSKAANEKANEQKTNTANEQKPGENKASTAQAPNKAEQNNRNAATEQNKRDAATQNNNTNTTNNTTTNTTTNKSAQNQTNPSGNLDPQKRVRISETISQHHDLADPVRNLNISITVGERVPSRIHLHSLPREIVTIAPEYRGYDYFTTEEDVVIVSPRTHEIVSRIPRDASRARAEVEGGSSGVSGGGSRTTMTTSSAGGGSAPCQVFRRTASGDLDRMDPSQLRETTGSGNSDHLAVKVLAPNGQDMPEVTLQQQQGRIIAETDGSGCRIILEPGKMSR